MKIVYKNKTSETPFGTDFQPWSKEGTNETIHFPYIKNEDTIESIKKKILLGLHPDLKPSSINEIYLYTKTYSNTSTLKVMQMLSNNFTTPITFELLNTFCKNFIDVDTSTLSPKKNSFEYFDILLNIFVISNLSLIFSKLLKVIFFF